MRKKLNCTEGSSLTPQRSMENSSLQVTVKRKRWQSSRVCCWAWKRLMQTARPGSRLSYGIPSRSPHKDFAGGEPCGSFAVGKSQVQLQPRAPPLRDATDVSARRTVELSRQSIRTNSIVARFPGDVLR